MHSMTPDLAQVHQWIAQAHQRHRPEEAWSRIYRQFLTPAHPFDLHLRLDEACYGPMDSGRPLGPAWLPDHDQLHHSNLGVLLGYTPNRDYPALHRFFANQRPLFWDLTLRLLDIRLRQKYDRILDLSAPTRPQWLLGAQLNIVDSCFTADDTAPAIICPTPAGPLQTTTYSQLRALANRVANALQRDGIRPGDFLAVLVPMNAESVAFYLGAIAAGAAIVSIAESFAPDEIATRLRIAPCKLLLTCDHITRAGKPVPIYEKALAAGRPPPSSSPPPTPPTQQQNSDPPTGSGKTSSTPPTSSPPSRATPTTRSTSSSPPAPPPTPRPSPGTTPPPSNAPPTPSTITTSTAAMSCAGPAALAG